jgi:predicted Zn-dependent protease
LKYLKWTGLILVCLLFLSGCAVNPVTGRNELALMNVSTQQEIELGGKSYGQALQKMGGVYPDQALNRYVDQIGQRLAKNSHRPELKYQFKVLNNSSPNAFALPGGFIAITRGLLLSIENEAQLAAVLGHEIGHVTARHSVQEMQRSSLLNAGAGLVGALAGDSGYSGLANQIGGLTANLLSKRYSRDQEFEADLLGVDYLARSGYSVNGAVGLQHVFINKLGGESRSNWMTGLFQTHPFSAERLQANKNYITKRYPAANRTFGEDASAYQNRIAALVQSQDAYKLYDQAKVAEQKGQIDLAVEMYHKAMQQAPDHGLLLTSLGMAYLRKEDIVPARRYFLKAIKADPDYFQSRMGLGYIYLANGRSADAAQQLEKSVKLFPTVQGVFLLAEAEADQGNNSKAVALYQVVVQADPSGKLGKEAVQRLRSLN